MRIKQLCKSITQRPCRGTRLPGRGGQTRILQRNITAINSHTDSMNTRTKTCQGNQPRGRNSAPRLHTCTTLKKIPSPHINPIPRSNPLRQTQSPHHPQRRVRPTADPHHTGKIWPWSVLAPIVPDPPLTCANATHETQMRACGAATIRTPLPHLSPLSPMRSSLLPPVSCSRWGSGPSSSRAWCAVLLLRFRSSSALTSSLRSRFLALLSLSSPTFA